MTRTHSLILVLSMGLSAGCLAPGEVAQFGCPADETCSEATPNGLHFQGPDFGDAWFSGGPLTMAVGGTQSIRVATGNSSGSPDFSLPFDAKSNGRALGIEAVAGPSVVLEGLVAGTAHLRIVEPGSDILYDRVAIDVAPVTSVEIEPANPFGFDWTGDGQQDDWVIFTGGSEVRVLVRLFGDTRLVDQSLVITGGTQTGWDEVRITPPNSGAVSVSALLGSGNRYSIDVPVVDALDDITPVQDEALNDMALPIAVGTSTLFCFRGDNAGRPVWGANWDAQGTANINVSSFTNCVAVEGVDVGDATLTVSAGGQSRDYVLSIVAASSQREEVAPSFTWARSTAGERAESVEFLQAQQL